MLVAKVIFQKNQSNMSDCQECTDIIEDYLTALTLNGQIWGEYQIGILDGVLQGYVTIPEKRSIIPRFTSNYAKSLSDKLKIKLGYYPLWSFLTDDEKSPWESWEESDFLFLRTNFLDNTSPVAMPYGDSGIPIPLYLLPIEDDIREYISRWCEEYRAHDQLWIGSGALEMLAYEQIANIESELSVQGREYCKLIEEATGIPIFFYQYRYFAYSNGEKNRKCPVCGGLWRQANVVEKNFLEFQFLCKPCRIVSHEGDSQEDEEFARIGDFAA